MPRFSLVGAVPQDSVLGAILLVKSVFLLRPFLKPSDQRGYGLHSLFVSRPLRNFRVRLERICFH